MLHRRNVLAGLVAAFAAPAIVRASSIMPVRVVRWVRDESVRGVKTWVSYPWVATIDYDRINPNSIPFSTLEESMHYWEQDGLTIQSLYVPPTYHPAPDEAALDGGFVPDLVKAKPFPADEYHPLRRSGFTVEEIQTFDIEQLKTLKELNKDSFKFVTLEELNTHRKPVGPRRVK